jgi:dolichol-phosphate mannosyltransferase
MNRPGFQLLLRFAMASLSSAVVDNVVFYLVFHASDGIAGAQVAAKTASVLFNYTFARRLVFSSDRAHRVLFPKYVALVCVNAVISYAGIRVLSSLTPLGVMQSKILMETMLFAVSFLIQRSYIFAHGTSEV